MQRKHFQNIIEAAIAAAGFTTEAAEALREVGRTANSIVTGEFEGCPLDLAGLYSSPASDQDWRFVRRFDNAMPTGFVRIED